MCELRKSYHHAIKARYTLPVSMGRGHADTTVKNDIHGPCWAPVYPTRPVNTSVILCSRALDRGNKYGTEFNNSRWRMTDDLPFDQILLLKSSEVWRCRLSTLKTLQLTITNWYWSWTNQSRCHGYARTYSEAQENPAISQCKPKKAPSWL